jgi:hypothetical protein
MAVLPSAETATELPCLAASMFPVPTNLSPCCLPGKRVGVTEKLSELLAVPPATVTEIVPVVAPGITMPSSVVPSFEMTIADTPPMLNAVGLLRFVPLMVTNVPTEPDEGLKDVMVGVCAQELRLTNKESSRKRNSLFIFIHLRVKVAIVLLFFS